LAFPDTNKDDDDDDDDKVSMKCLYDNTNFPVCSKHVTDKCLV